MCDHCGCSTPGPRSGGHSHEHEHGHGHAHDHDHEHGSSDEKRVIEAHASLRAQNDRLAADNRGYFRGCGVGVVNLVSAPGSGKTALIERTIRDVGAELKIGVIVGDLATENDAERIRRHGAPAVQVTTGTVCHLDAHMVHHAADRLDLRSLGLLFIENVGNLVCPASFDLGEDERAVVIAVTEGEDKPLKYPSIFQNAAVVLVNKIDLAAAAEWDRARALDAVRRAAPGAEILEVSARTGAGMDAWYARLRALAARKRGP